MGAVGTSGLRAAALAAALLTAAGCGLLTPPVADPPPGVETTDLEARVARDVSDVDAVMSLVMAYLRSERLEDAQGVLDDALETVPRERTLLAASGVVRHGLGMSIEAREAYDAFLEAFPNDAAVGRIRARLDAVRTRALLSEARLLVEGRSVPSVPSEAVAVLPFARDAADPGFVELSIAVADQIAGDLSAAAVAVTDPTIVRALVEAGGVPIDGEMTLAEARSAASLLGARRVLYGTMDTEGFGDLLMRATVVDFGPDSVSIVGFATRGSLANVHAMSRRVAMLAVEGVTQDISSEAARAVARRPLTGLPTLVAMGRGLIASARGDHGGAEPLFRLASTMDPAFVPASEFGNEASLAVLAEAESTLAAIAEIARVGGLTRAVSALTGSDTFEGTLANARERRAIVEALGQDGLVNDVLIELVLTVPAASP